VDVAETFAASGAGAVARFSRVCAAPEVSGCAAFSSARTSGCRPKPRMIAIAVKDFLGLMIPPPE